jgi:hypothetical protein
MTMQGLLYDIFSGAVDDDPLWLEAVKDLNAATVRMEERAREIPGRYFIFSSDELWILRPDPNSLTFSFFAVV